MTPPAWFGHEGIDLRVDAQLALLGEMEAPERRELFGRLRADPGLNRATPGRADGLISNDYFPSPDADLYAAMVVRERPHRIVEVGSGFSTRVARHAIEHAGLSCELCVVDPEPRLDVDGVADRVARVRVEESGLAAAADPDHHRRAGGHPGPDRSGGLPPVEPGTLLFIDSSHVMEAVGDWVARDHAFEGASFWTRTT